MEKEVLKISNYKKNSYKCKNFKVKEIGEAFKKISDNEKLLPIHMDSKGNERKNLGFVFLVHDDNTANKLALLKDINAGTNDQENGAILIKIPNISYSISLTIRSHEDIEKLNRYLRDEYDEPDRTFVLCFPEGDVLHRVQDSLDTINCKYVVMDNTVLYRGKVDFDYYSQYDNFEEHKIQPCELLDVEVDDWYGDSE